jgi:hypothetical protein
MSDEMMSVSAGAAYLGWRESTMRSHILHRKVTYVKLGRRVFLRKMDLDALIERSVVPALSPLPSRRPRDMEAAEAR